MSRIVPNDVERLHSHTAIGPPKYACPCLFSQYHSVLAQLLGGSVSLIAGEEECTFLPEWTSCRGAKRIVDELRPLEAVGIIEESVRVERSIAKELKKTAMEAICPGPAHHLNLSPAAAT